MSMDPAEHAQSVRLGKQSKKSTITMILCDSEAKESPQRKIMKKKTGETNVGTERRSKDASLTRSSASKALEGKTPTTPEHKTPKRTRDVYKEESSCSKRASPPCARVSEAGEQMTAKTPELKKKNANVAYMGVAGCSKVADPSPSTNALEKPEFRLPAGWSRQVNQRLTGKSAGQYDVYVINPDRRRFRSKNELVKFLSNHPNQEKKFNLEELFRRPAPLSLESDSTPRKAAEELAGGSKANPPKGPVFKKRRGRKAKRDFDQLSYEEMEENVKYDFLQQDSMKRYKPAEWEPPMSPYNLIQETLRHDEFQLLVASILLNKSPVLQTDVTGNKSSSKILAMLHRWPTPEAMVLADVRDIALAIKLFGKEKKRAQDVKEFAEEFMAGNFVYPYQCSGIRRYGQDSYRIFYEKRYLGTEPNDLMFMMYRNWIIQNWDAFPRPEQDSEDESM